MWAPDFPGFGVQKLPKKPYQLLDYALFLQQYIIKHEIHSPGLIGHSFGGRVALKYDSLFPKSTSWIVLSGTPGFRSSTFKARIAIVIAKLGKIFFTVPLISTFKNSITESYYAFVSSREYSRAEGTMKETFKQIVSESLLPYMKSLSVPCLLLWGERDRMVPIRIAFKMHEIIPGSTLSIIPSTDHSVPYVNPEEFVRRMMEFHFI